jgi:hypothetical protein
VGWATHAPNLEEEIHERCPGTVPPGIRYRTHDPPMTTTTSILGDGDVWPLLKGLTSRKRRAAAKIAAAYIYIDC